MKKKAKITIGCIALFVVSGCASIETNVTTELPVPTKYLDISSGSEVSIDVDRKMECQGPENYYCFWLPSARIFTIPKSEKEALSFYSGVNASGDGWQVDDIRYFISDVIDYDIFGLEGPFYKVILVAGDTTENITFLEDTIFSYKYGIIVTMQQIEIHGIDSPMDVPFSVDVPIAYENQQ